MKKLSLSVASLIAVAILAFSVSCSKEGMKPEVPQTASKKASSGVTATMKFNTTSSGVDKSMHYWVVGTASSGLSIERLGGEIDVVRVGGFQKWPLNNDGSLKQEAKTHLDGEIEQVVKFFAVNPNVQISLCSSAKKGKVDAYFIKNGQIRVGRWTNMFKEVRRYLLAKLQEKGYSTSVAFIEVNNEPDWKKYGSKENMKDIMAKMKADNELGSIPQVGPSTLNCANANKFWNVIKNKADWGATHMLGGSMWNYINFVKKVNSEGKPFYNSEAHCVAEMIVAAEYGCKGGLWWYPVSEHEAGFTHVQFGKRICYKEVRENWAAAAGYKGEGNTIHLYVSAPGRFGNNNTSTIFTLECEDREVSFDGGEKKKSHTVTIGKNDTRHIVVTW